MFKIVEPGEPSQCEEKIKKFHKQDLEPFGKKKHSHREEGACFNGSNVWSCRYYRQKEFMCHLCENLKKT